MGNKINVALITRYEEVADNFLSTVCEAGSNNINYNDTEIVFNDIWNESLEKEKVSEFIQNNDRVVLLVDSLEGVTPTVSNAIIEIIKTNRVPILVINNINEEDADPYMALQEIEHVLVMRDASDRQLEAPLVYVDDAKKVALFDLEEESDNLNSLYETIITM